MRQHPRPARVLLLSCLGALVLTGTFLQPERGPEAHAIGIWEFHSLPSLTSRLTLTDDGLWHERSMSGVERFGTWEAFEGSYELTETDPATGASYGQVFALIVPDASGDLFLTYFDGSGGLELEPVVEGGQA